MTVNKRVREYLDLAERKGFDVTPSHISNGHIVLEVYKDGVHFSTVIPSTPSDHRGAHRFVQDLKRGFRKNLAA